MDLVMERDRIQYLDDKLERAAEVTFPVVEPGVVEINRTFVDESLRGQGVAGQLMGRGRGEHRRERLLRAPHVLLRP